MKIFKKVLFSLFVLVFLFGLFSLIKVQAATTVNLLTADNFAVLAGSAITDTTPSVISGDVGLSPAGGTSYVGLTAGAVTGTIYAVDGTGPVGSINNPSLLTAAKNDLTTAYSNASQPQTGVISADLGGQTLIPGVYKDNGAPASLAISGTLTLDGQGDPNAVFIFQSASTLTTASASHVNLINSAQACNVFWQIGSSATFGTNSVFKGNVLAASSITDNGGSTIEGRFLAKNGAVTLNNTHLVKATCVTPPTTPSSSAQGGGPLLTAPPVPPLINVTKIPTPLALPSGPGLVTYNYVVSNVGTVPMTNIIVTDNKCSTVTFVSGDINNNSKLDTYETWNYRCTTNLTQTTTNTVTATGQANGFTVADTANATVVVNLPIIPPLIHIVKKPNVFLLPATGGAVTYTYTVTNPGTAPLSDVSVTDNKCTGLPGRVVGHPGDLNHNNLLESNETWTFVCQTNLTQTTTNIGTAEGSANGLTAIDFSPATVVVSAPSLPKTGFPPEEQNIPWAMIILSSFSIVSILFYVLQKRKSI